MRGDAILQTDLTRLGKLEGSNRLTRLLMLVLLLLLCLCG